jgi:hypothetical protein
MVVHTWRRKHKQEDHGPGQSGQTAKPYLQNNNSKKAEVWLKQ